MIALRNLNQIYNDAAERFSMYEGNDFILPSEFRQKVKYINGCNVLYNDYSAIIQTKGVQKGSLNIFLPNQWFYVASYFTALYNEIKLYREFAFKVTTKERLHILNNNTLNEDEERVLNSLDLDQQSKVFLKKFITDYSWWHGAKTIERGDCYVSPILSCASLVNSTQSYVAELCAFLADKKELTDAIIQGAELNQEFADGRTLNVKSLESPTQLQQIFYGAPGTGKSHSVKTETEAWEERGRVVRTTFHPDSDYSTFVGAYKPTTESVQRYDIYNKPMTRDGVPVMEQIITYEFVGQAFLQSYIDAWKNREEPEFLIIEEINRGNCAQIFGDLFQLLDRGDDGYSEYAIKADKDLQKYLSKAFKEVEIEDFPNVKAGKELLLPNNLYIRATMNTSDQSLFPIDSAFKRRWDWKYRPISNAQLGWKIEADGMLYDWWEFLERINREIGTTTNSEDKKLGYFFCKAKEGRISAETFVGKVVFYLWNDVFKDYDLSNSFFDDGEGGKLTFDKFHTTEGMESKIVEEKVDLFLRNLDLSPIENSATESEIEDEDGNTPETSSRNYDKFTVNDGAECGKNRLAFNCITEYVKLNPGITAQEVYEKWSSLGNIVSHFIETEVQYNSRTDKSKRSESVDCYGTPVYVSCNGYGSNGKADHLMRLVNEKDWGITIKKFEK